MNSNVSAWYEKMKHIDKMIGWDKGKLKIWEQQVANNFPFGAKILDIGRRNAKYFFSQWYNGSTGVWLRKFGRAVQLQFWA